MIKFTNKQLKELANEKYTIDLTKSNHKSVNEPLDQIGYAHGIYGTMGKLWEGRNSGRMYVAHSYSSAIYRY